MPFTKAERTFLKGGRNPHEGIRSNPNRFTPKPALPKPVPKPAHTAKPMGFSKGTVWSGEPSPAQKLNQASGKWLSPDATTKSGFAKNNAAANRIVKPVNWGSLLKTYMKGRVGLDSLVWPGTAMAPSAKEMGIETRPNIWFQPPPPRAVVSPHDMDDYNIMQAERERYGY